MVVRTLAVPFEGPGSGTERLAWGQQELWMAMQRQQSWLPMGGVMTLPPGHTLDNVVGELQYMMSRYQCLRTRLRLGSPHQVVFSSGTLTLEIAEAGLSDPDTVALEISQRFSSADLDHEREWPIRVAAVTQGGAPVRLVIISCHLIADAFGFGLMASEIRDRVTSPVSGMQALEQARWQQSPPGQRQNTLAMRYLEQALRTVPLRRFSSAHEPQSPRHWRGEFSSPALHLATQAIAAKSNMDVSPVLLAVYAVALAQVTGVNPVVTRPIVSNRFRTALADVVSTVAQSGLCVMDVARRPFPEVLTTVRRAAMTAYKHAYYDPEDFAALLEKVSAERGPGLDLACFFNDRRVAVREPANVAVPAPGEILAARAATTLQWTDKRDIPFERLFVHIDDVPGTIQLTVFMDTKYFSPDDATTFLYGMEDVAITAATET